MLNLLRVCTDIAKFCIRNKRRKRRKFAVVVTFNLKRDKLQCGFRSEGVFSFKSDSITKYLSVVIHLSYISSSASLLYMT